MCSAVSKIRIPMARFPYVADLPDDMYRLSASPAIIRIQMPLISSKAIEQAVTTGALQVLLAAATGRMGIIPW